MKKLIDTWAGTDQDAVDLFLGGGIEQSELGTIRSAIAGLWRRINRISYNIGAGAVLADPGTIAASGGATTCAFVCRVVDHIGMPVAAVHQIIVTVTGSATLSETGAGAEVQGTGTNCLVLTTDATGQFTLTVTDALDETVLVTMQTVYTNTTTLTEPPGSNAIVDSLADRYITYSA